MGAKKNASKRTQPREDHLRVKAGGSGGAGKGNLPGTWVQRTDLLQLEEEVWEYRGQ